MAFNLLRGYRERQREKEEREEKIRRLMEETFYKVNPESSEYAIGKRMMLELNREQEKLRNGNRLYSLFYVFRALF